MAKAKKANPSTKRSPAAQALWRWLRTAGTYLRVFVRGIVYLLWSKSWIVFTPLGVLLAVFLFSYSPSDPAFTFTTDAQASNWAASWAPGFRTAFSPPSVFPPGGSCSRPS